MIPKDFNPCSNMLSSKNSLLVAWLTAAARVFLGPAMEPAYLSKMILLNALASTVPSLLYTFDSSAFLAESISSMREASAAVYFLSPPGDLLKLPPVRCKLS